MQSPDENLGFGCWPDFIRMNLRKFLQFCPVQKAQILTFRIRPLHLLSRVLVRKAPRSGAYFAAETPPLLPPSISGCPRLYAASNMHCHTWQIQLFWSFFRCLTVGRMNMMICLYQNATLSGAFVETRTIL